MLVLKIEKCLLGSLRKRGRVICQTKPSASLSEGILFLQEVFPPGEDSRIQTERWVFVTSFLSVKGLVRSYQARLSDQQISVLSRKAEGGFPGGAVVKNPPANAGDTGSSPGPGRSHMPWSN